MYVFYPSTGSSFGKPGYLRPLRRPQTLRGFTCALLLNVGALLTGCDGQTTRPMLSLDSSFVGGDGFVFNDDARTAPGDGDQGQAAADSSVVDAQTVASDATVLRDFSALMDQSPAADVVLPDAAVGDGMDAAVLPSECGEIPFMRYE